VRFARVEHLRFKCSADLPALFYDDASELICHSPRRMTERGNTLVCYLDD